MCVATESMSIDMPDPLRAITLDYRVGIKIQERRIVLGLSQEQLAAAIGITYRQALQYEQGLARVSASRLIDIADALKVPLAWFFETLDAQFQDASAAAFRPQELSTISVQIDSDMHQDALIQMARSLMLQSMKIKSVMKYGEQERFDAKTVIRGAGAWRR